MAGPELVFARTPNRAAGQRVIASPFEFFTTGEDNVRIIGVNSLSNVTLMIQGRSVDVDGTIIPIRDALAVPATRVVTQKDIVLSGGAVLNFVVFASGASPLIGQTYVIAQLIRGVGAAAIVLGELFAGYVTATQPLAWPGSPIQSSIDGGGCIRSVTGSTPAAGAVIQETVPTGARWELLDFRFTLTTSAVAPTRGIEFKWAQSGQGARYVPSNVPQPASWVYTYTFAPNIPVNTNVSVGLVTFPMGLPVTLLAGGTISIDSTNLDVGDQFSAPQFTVREWLEVA